MKIEIKVLFLFILGVFFRLLVIHLFPQTFIFDQTEYDRFARGILSYGLYAETARLYGYPLLLSLIYKIFGLGNLYAVYVVQTVFDSSSGVLIYLIGRKIFRKKQPAIIASALYMLNPFTSALVGALVTEILTTTLLTLAIYCFVRFLQKPHYTTLLGLGFCLGFLPQVRPSFFVYSIGMMLFIFLMILRSRKKIKLKLGQAVGFSVIFILPFIYTIFGNLNYFKQFSPLTVDNLLVREFYLSLYLRPDGTSVDRPEVRQIYDEYSFPKSSRERNLMAKKYFQLTLAEISRDKFGFVQKTTQKLYQVWEKRTIFLYRMSGDPYSILYLINIILVGAGFYGVVIYIKRHYKQYSYEYFLIGTSALALFLYITIFHVITVSEERYSIPSYPMVILFAGLTLHMIYHKIKYPGIKYD